MTAKAISRARRLLRDRYDLLDAPPSMAADDELEEIDRQLVALVPSLLDLLENGHNPSIKPEPWMTAQRRKRAKRIP